VAVAIYRLFNSDIRFTHTGLRRPDCFRALHYQIYQEKLMHYLTQRNFEVLLFLSYDDEIATSYKCTAYTAEQAKKAAQEAYPTGIITRVVGVAE